MGYVPPPPPPGSDMGLVNQKHYIHRPKGLIYSLKREGDSGPFCPQCGSSLKSHFFLFKTKKCIHKQCGNYFNRHNEPFLPPRPTCVPVKPQAGESVVDSLPLMLPSKLGLRQLDLD
jgi:hypothetical protein